MQAEKYHCFELPFVGVRGLCDDKSTSGYYLNDLPGITIDRLAKTANAEDLSGAKLAARLERVAIDQVRQDLLAKLSPHYQFNRVIHSGTYGEHGTEKVDRGGIWKGVELYRYRDEEFKRIRVDWIEVNVADHAETDIWIGTGVEDPSLLETAEDPCDFVGMKKVLLKKCGVNRIKVDETFDAERVRIFYKSSTVSPMVVASTCPSRCVCDDYNIFVRGIENNDGCWKGATSWNGIKVKASVICDECCFFESYMDLLGPVVRYSLAIQWMYERINSDRINNLVSYGKEQAQQNLLMLNGGYDRDNMVFLKRGEYHIALDAVVNQIKNSVKESDCFTCSGFSIKENVI